MRMLLDTNVILDHALGREPFRQEADKVVQWCIDSADGVFIAFHTFTNAYYVLRSRQAGFGDDTQARTFLASLLSWADLAPTSKQQLLDSLSYPAVDLEDTLQALCATDASADYIITRDPSGFTGSTVPALSPAQFLADHS